MVEHARTGEESRIAPGLATSHRDLHHLLEDLPAGAYLCDRDGLITYFNQHALELWGRAPKLNDPSDRFCGSFRLFAADGSAIPHDQWCVIAVTGWSNETDRARSREAGFDHHLVKPLDTAELTRLLAPLEEATRSRGKS
jgi:PAS domain-containing protein